MKKIINIAGARPNFIKIAPVMEAIGKTGMFEQILVHTGQHYDEKMSGSFFADLELPKPDLNLEVGSGSHAFQTAEIMKRFEPVLLEYRPDYIIVVGDVNSTIACALAASKLGVKIIHVEAGLRSFDRTMPEEINRVLTDAISDILFTTEKSAAENLISEGIQKDKIFFVGNVMIDTLIRHLEKSKRSTSLHKLGLASEAGGLSGKGHKKNYGLLTLHRPGNVDNKEKFRRILEALAVISRDIPVIFPVHPRTRKMMEEFGFDKMTFITSRNMDEPTHTELKINGLIMVDPLGYLDFLNLMANSKIVLTDSGGMQEETTFLGIPCITLRDNTERPVTIEEGTNVLVGSSRERLIEEGLKALNGNMKKGSVPELWDGRAAERIAEVIIKSSR